ncbi:Uncharacterized protein PCOAH_00019070 [Plasmodium coatneyi]|uniref:KIR protein n=1 Tax=Plasmodium coatneyi TaxID=208452 RepID=A0A1B1DWU2_9APIC|nr:Uncharacterized protein PCOAH_00019070 [Plasmodium coatneyi]ANQ07252.1 Uncharacterized protein PCOAH_00019070 [Plasmodium coatneyi]
MRDIYMHLSKLELEDRNKHKCTDIYPQISRDFFEAIKKFHDYNYNYNALRENPECTKHVIHPGSRTVKGTPQYGYSWSCNECKTYTNEYCKEFKQKYMKDGETCDPLELPKLTCPPVAVKPATAAKPATTGTCNPGSCPNPNPNQAGSSGSFSDADSGDAASSIAPAAVSGGLATIGIPAALFFLYKVRIVITVELYKNIYYYFFLI